MSGNQNHEQAEATAGAAPGARTLSLSPQEAEALLRCCLKYRASIPAYLQSTRAEIETMNAIVKKLEAIAAVPPGEP